MNVDSRIKYPLRSDFFGGIGFRAAADPQRGAVIECRWSSSQIKRFCIGDGGLVEERLPPRGWKFSGTYNTPEAHVEVQRLMALAYPPVQIAPAPLPTFTLKCDRGTVQAELGARLQALVMDMCAQFGEDSVILLP